MTMPSQSTPEYCEFERELIKIGKKVKELENTNQQLIYDNASLQAEYKNSLEESSQKISDLEDKASRLERESKSQGLELCRVQEEYNITNDHLEQKEKQFTELASKYRNDKIRHKKEITALSAQVVENETQLSAKIKENHLLRSHNKLLAINGQSRQNKSQVTNQSQICKNDVKERSIDDNQDEPLRDHGNSQNSSPTLASSITSVDSKMSNLPENRQPPLDTYMCKEHIEQWKETVETDTRSVNFNGQILFRNFESGFSRNTSSKLRLNHVDKKDNITPEKLKSYIEFTRSTIHDLICRWIDVEINFLQIILVFILDVFIRSWTVLCHFLAQSLCLMQQIKSHLRLLRDKLLFFLLVPLKKSLFSQRLHESSLSDPFASQESQISKEAIIIDEPTSDQKPSQKSRTSSCSEMNEEEINLLGHNLKKFTLKSNSNKFYEHESIVSPRLLLSPSSGCPIYNTETYDTGSELKPQLLPKTVLPIEEPNSYRTKTSQSLGNPSVSKMQINDFSKNSSEHYIGNSSCILLVLRLLSFLFFAPHRADIIDGGDSKFLESVINSNAKLRPICLTSYRQRIPILNKFIIVNLKSVITNCRKLPVWLTIIAMIVHLCVYIVFHNLWLTLHQLPLSRSSYYTLVTDSSNLNGWAHQLYFSEQWAYKLERLTYSMGTYLGLQVKNFPMPG